MPSAYHFHSSPDPDSFPISRSGTVDGRDPVPLRSFLHVSAILFRILYIPGGYDWIYTTINSIQAGIPAANPQTADFKLVEVNG